MATQQMTFLIPPYGTATLTLPDMLTPEAFARLDTAIDHALGQPHRQVDEPLARDPGSVEYNSWLVDQH